MYAFENAHLRPSPSIRISRVPRPARPDADRPIVRGTREEGRCRLCRGRGLPCEGPDGGSVSVESLEDVEIVVGVVFVEFDGVVVGA